MGLHEKKKWRLSLKKKISFNFMDFYFLNESDEEIGFTFFGLWKLSTMDNWV